MKKIFFIEDTVENKVSYFHLAAFLAALPFDFFYSELILISFALHTLIHVKRKDVKKIFVKPVLIPVSFFLLNLVAVLYSSDKQEGINLSTRQLGILLFPVLVAISQLDFARYKIRLLSIFGFSCTVTVAYLYFDALRTISGFHMPMSSLFTLNFMNHDFAKPIGIHATYLSVYIAFSMIIFLYLLLTRQVHQKWIYILTSVILLAGLLQLSSRAVFIAFMVVVNLVFPFLLFRGSKRSLFFLITSVISIAVFVLIYNIDSFKVRYVSELKTDLTDEVRIIENTEPRVARWEVIMELVKRSPVIGYGNGSESQLLKEKYFEEGLYISYLNEFNTHNQYLSILLKTGIIGLLLFFFILCFGYAVAIKRKDLLLLSFMVIITVVSMSENVLELNKGIFFYAFFFSFLMMQGRAGITQNTSQDIVNPGNPDKPDFV